MIDDDLLEVAAATGVSGGEDDGSGAVKVAAEPKPVERPMLKKIIQGALLAAGQPLPVDRLRGLFDPVVDVEPERSDILTVLEEIAAECTDAGFELVEVGSGWRYQVRAETAPWVNRLWEEKPQKYSRALLETLSLIAYRQPITRGDIEEIRGVAVSSHIIKTLTERDWVKVVGHRDVPGRPSLYATTRQFLDYFNLKSLDELPSLSEIADFDKLGPELDLPLNADDDASSTTEASAVEGLVATEEFVDIDQEAAEAFLSAVADQVDDVVEPMNAVETADKAVLVVADDVERPESGAVVSAASIEEDAGEGVDHSRTDDTAEESMEGVAEATADEDSSEGGSGATAKPLPSLFND